MGTRFRHYSAILFLAVPVMLVHLGGVRLWDRDEPRNAGCAAEMAARGDWIVPVFNAELRTHKPILLYWLILSSYSMLGISEFAARIPSACLAIGTALCTYEIARRFFSPRAGMWAGIAVSTSLLFVMAGRAATPDATLIFCCTAALAAYVLAAIPDPAAHSHDARTTEATPNFFPARWWQVALVYAAMGMAVLAKGPVGLVLPTAVLGMFLLIVRVPARSSFWDSKHRAVRWFSWARVFAPRHFFATCWRMRPITAIAVCLAVAGPWYAWVGWRTDGEFLRGFFLEHNVSRALATMEGHRGNLLFYPVAILVGFFPWSVFAVPLGIETVATVRRNDPWKAGCVFAACWIGVYVTVFSLAKTKLPSYVTPCYPALAMLTGAHLDRWLRGVSVVPRGWHYVAVGVWTLVGVILALALPIVAHVTFRAEHWLGVIGLAPMISGLLCLYWIRHRQVRRAAWTFAISAAAFVLLLFAVAADRADHHQLQHRLWATMHKYSDHPRLAAFDCLEPSWVFYGGRPVEQITHGAVGPTHNPWIEQDGRWIPKPHVDFDRFLSQPGDAWVITTERQLANVRGMLPPGYEVFETVPYFLKKERLVLLGPTHRVANRK